MNINNVYCFTLLISKFTTLIFNGDDRVDSKQKGIPERTQYKEHIVFIKGILNSIKKGTLYS